MKKNSFVRELVHSVCSLRAARTAENVSVYSNPSIRLKEQFVIFTKPELLLTPKRRQLASAFSDFAERFDELGIAVQDVRVISGRYVDEYSLIDKCYDRLNEVSRLGLRACAEAQISQIEIQASNESVNSKSIMGGDQFIRNFSEYSPNTLCDLIDNLGCYKFGAGVYGTFMTLRGRRILVLNGFYPAQREWLSSKSAPMVALLLTANLHPKRIREQLVGDIFPHKADPRTLRGMCYLNSQKFGLSSVSISRNCVHYSANPIDAYYYMKILFNLSPLQTQFGKRAKALGVDPNRIRKLYESRSLKLGKNLLDLRDRVEDNSSEKCLGLLERLVKGG